MSQENYINYYIETLTSTLQDAIVRNISMQANAKVTDDTLQSFANENKSLKEQIAGQQGTENRRILELEATIVEQNKTIYELRTQRSDVENIRHQLQHLETFRTQLANTQLDNDSLKKQLQNMTARCEELENSAAKKTKKTSTKKEEIVETPVEVVQEVEKPKVVMSTKDIFKK